VEKIKKQITKTANNKHLLINVRGFKTGLPLMMTWLIKNNLFDEINHQYYIFFGGYLAKMKCDYIYLA